MIPEYRKLVMIFSLFASLGCETVVDIEIPAEPPQLVVNSTLVGGAFFRVNLTESQHILDSDFYNPVQGAKVEIYENGTLLTTLPDSLNGNYISNQFEAKKGSSYQIKVSKSGFQDVLSNVVVPLDTVNFMEITVDTLEIDDFGYLEEYLRFSIDFKDNPNIKNYYDFSIYREYYGYIYDYDVSPPVLIDSTLTITHLYIESNDPILEEYQTYGQNIMFDDDYFNGKEHIMNLLFLDYLNNQYWSDDLVYESASTYYIKMSSTSESHYLYGLSAQLQLWNSDNPFAQPVTVYNNIENGFGVFGAYNASVYKVE